MEEQGGWPMGHAFGVHRMNERKVIHLAGDVGKKRGNLLSAFAVLLEIPKGFHELPLALFAEGCGTDADEVDILAVHGDEFGLVVEGVDVAGPTRHEDKDYALGSLRDEGGLCSQWITRYGMGSLHAGHSERTKSTRRAFQHVATGDRLVEM